MSGFRAWWDGLPPGVRWIFLGVVGVLVVTVVAGGIWSWLGHREELAQRSLSQVLVTAQRANASGQPPELEGAATALRQYLTAHSSARASVQAWYVLGQVEFRRSQWDAALAAFAEASRRDRGSIGLLSRLGQGYAYEAKGEPAKAEPAKVEPEKKTAVVAEKKAPVVAEKKAPVVAKKAVPVKKAAAKKSDDDDDDDEPAPAKKAPPVKKAPAKKDKDDVVVKDDDDE